MQNLHIIIILMLTIGILFWAVLIGSSLWAACVRYVSDGEKDCKRLSVKLASLDGTYDAERYNKGQYQRIKSEMYWVVSICVSLLYVLLCVGLQGLIFNGYGDTVLIVLSAILTVVTFMKTAKWVYAINSKLNKHTKDKNAHS
jgi:hypothetical protein